MGSNHPQKRCHHAWNDRSSWVRSFWVRCHQWERIKVGRQISFHHGKLGFPGSCTSVIHMDWVIYVKDCIIDVYQWFTVEAFRFIYHAQHEALLCEKLVAKWPPQPPTMVLPSLPWKVLRQRPMRCFPTPRQWTQASRHSGYPSRHGKAPHRSLWFENIWDQWVLIWNFGFHVFFNEHWLSRRNIYSQG